ncbi:Putative neugrin-like protein [Termitomyces sp. J132]|nr:hypothetical protein C0989_006806 [Termitomyces sp. Mn162]KNZ78313.1 Putative neugrin-like protein [Termitomyces sp. J132]
MFLSFYRFALCCPRASLTRFYSVQISYDSRRKWALQGLPRPRSILDDNDTPVDLSEDDDAVNGVRPNTPPLHLRQPPKKPTPHEYKVHREVIKKNFPAGWNPPHKVSREAMEGIRQMHRLDPEKFSTPILAEKFKISPEAVRRILKSRWEPPREKRLKLAERERAAKMEYFSLKRVRERMEARAARESADVGTDRDRLQFE